MSQQNIDFGTFPDDPSADAIRTAFNKVQNNFDQLFGANANTTVTSINRTPGAGITVNYPTGNVVVSANLACLQVSTSSLKMGRGGNTGSNALITQSSQTLVIDINPDHVYSNYFADVNDGLAIFNGNLSSNSNYQPNLTSFGNLTSLNVEGRANFTGSNTYISSVSNLHIPGGGAGYTIVTDGAGNLSWSAVTAGNGVPGGNATEIQFQGSGGNVGLFEGNSGFTFTTGNGLLQTPLLTVAGNTISANFIGALANGNSNISITGNSNITFTSNSNSTMIITDTGANITGTANITGNISSGNANLGNLTTSNYFSGVLDSLSNSQPNITSVGTLTNVSVTGNVDTTGELNVTNNNEHGGTGYAGIMTMTNTGGGTNPNKFLRINSTGNLQIINSGYSATIFDLSDAGNLSQISTLNVSGNANVGTDLTVTGNTLISGNLTVAGNTTYYNITSFVVQDPIISLGGGPNGNALTSNDGKDRGTALQYYTTTPVTAFMGWDNSNSEFAFGSNVTITSEVVSYNNLGNARGLTWLGNIDGSYANFTGNIYTTGNANLGNSAVANYFIGRFYGNANTAGTVTTNAQPNITSVGTLTSLVVGNATANATFGNGTIALTSAGNVTGGNLLSATYLTGTLTTAAQPNITSVNTSFTGLTFASNGNITMSGTGSQLSGANLVSASYFSGNGNGLSSIVGANVTGTVGSATNAAALLQNTSTATTVYPTFTTSSANGNSSAVINTSISANLGNASITATTFVGALSGAATTAGTVTTAAQPNITSVSTSFANLTFAANGNITMSGASSQISGANLVSASYFSGNGNGLSSIAGANVTGIVANATSATSATNASALLQNTSTSTTVYPMFTTSSANGNSSSVINTSISANLGNASITATTFVGALSGTATSATSATSATNAAAVQTNTATTNTIYLAGVSSSSNGNSALNIVTGITANFAANTISATTFNGNLSGGNVNVSGQLTSTIATSTAPLVVTSTTRVANLNVTYANVSDYGAITAQTTGTYYPVVASGSTSGNYALAVGPTGISFNLATNTVTATSFSGNLTATGTVQAANITATAYITRAVTTNISANGAGPSGNTQANATALTTEINIVSTVNSGTGVRLPAAVAGTVVYITNNSANSLLVYPQTNGIINNQAANAAFTQGANATLQYMAPTTTQWYTIGATYA